MLPHPEHSRKLAEIEKKTIQILSILFFLSLWFQSWPISIGLILGGVVAIINFHWLWKIMEKVIGEKKRFHGVQIVVKFFTLLATLFIILRFSEVNFVAFIVGISSLLPGLLLVVVPESLRAEKKGNG